jgi:hypothetical protein
VIYASIRVWDSIENLMHIVSFPSSLHDVWKQVKLNAYYNTFSSSGVIKLFLKMSIFKKLFVWIAIFLRNYHGWKNVKIVRNPWAFCFKKIHHWATSIQYLATSLYPIIWWNIMFPQFCKKKQYKLLEKVSLC